MNLHEAQIERYSKTSPRMKQLEEHNEQMAKVISDIVEWDDAHYGDVIPDQLIEAARSVVAKAVQS